MNVQQIMTKVLQTNAAVEIMNELVIATLQSSKETLVLERERLDKFRLERPLRPYEETDWTEIVQDIVAIDRLLNYYGEL